MSLSSPLNVSIIPKSVTPECFYQESKLLKGKNMDSHLLVTPAIFKPGSKLFKNMDSRLNLGNDKKGLSPLNASTIPFVRHP